MKSKHYKLSADYINWLAHANFNSPMHYKILFMLYGKSMTQVQLCKELGIKNPQNITKIINHLMSEGVIETDFIVGRNKYLKAVTDFKVPDPNQMTLDDIMNTTDKP